MKYLKWINVVLGAALFVAPFVLNYSSNTGALWTSLILGILIAGLGYLQSYKWAAAMGVITFIVPFVVGLSSTALWTSVILGGLVAILDGYQAWFAGEDKSGAAQHGHA